MWLSDDAYLVVIGGVLHELRAGIVLLSLQLCDSNCSDEWKWVSNGLLTGGDMLRLTGLCLMMTLFC